MKTNVFTQWNLQVLLFVIPEYLSPQSLKVKGLHNHTSRSNNQSNDIIMTRQIILPDKYLTKINNVPQESPA